MDLFFGLMGLMKYKDTIIGGLLLFLFIIALVVQYEPQAQSADVVLPTGSIFPQKGIAVVDLYGPIAFPQYSTSVGPMGANAVLDQLYKIKDDTNIKGLILRINSPGGTVAASQEIYQAVKAVKAALNIPIVAQIGDVGASGAYYAALGADTIFANPGSLVGSIGVIIGGLSIYELAQKHGVDYNVYKSGAYKDLLSMWRPPTAEEQTLLQTVIDDVYEQFKSDFIDSRKISADHATILAQGQLYTGNQALELQMVDKIGGYKDALVYIGELTGLGANPNVISKVSYGFSDVFQLLNNSFQGQSLFNATAVPQLR